MSYRRRHRWFRRMALGLAFATAVFAGRASVAAAKADEGVSGSRYVSTAGWSGLVDMETGIPIVADPYLTDVFVRPGESLGGPDGQAIVPDSNTIAPYGDAVAFANAINDQAIVPAGDAVAFANAIKSQEPTVTPYLSPVIVGEAVKSQQVAAVRPDDLANRFAHSDVASRPELASSGSTFEWNDALTLGIGALVLALGLGLAVGYLRRPRLAGL